ncbi:MAG: TIGR00159 family protein [Salinivirgaceae bacterium]|nr:TIGR00159 family protein [Salinivirgaceae bacterium]
MTPLFITLRFFDLLDILLVAFLLYQLYSFIKGTVAINIFVGILVVIFLWWLVKLLNMSLLSSILGSVIGVGVIAVIIVFQQEIRRFLLLLGTQEIFNRRYPFQKYFDKGYTNTSSQTLKQIVRACRNLSKTKTGALIVISTNSELVNYVQSGDVLNADVSHRLLESIFFKNSPMHDGAAIVVGNKLKAARCVLPINDDIILPAQLGLRHRAALSMSMETDVVVVIVSEETGKISMTKGSELKIDLSHETLFALLIKEFMVNKKPME